MAYSTRASFNKTHQLNFSAAVAQINEAIQRGLPNAQEQSKYRKVGVLMMHWSNDDLGTVPLETELATVFDKVYNFEVETYVIPAYPPPGPKLNVIFSRRLKDFVRKYEGPQSLMIYVYSGHADAGPPPLYDACNWYGTTATTNCPQLDWAGHRWVPDYSEGDSLYILDRCYATTAAINKTESEYLIAASTENIAGSVTQTSFTRRLIDPLRANNGAPQTVASIHASMISNMKSTNTRMEWTQVHVAANAKPTIIIQRLATKTPQDVQKVKQFDTRSAGKVLISGSLQGQASLPDVRSFEKWLWSHLPPNVASVKVEAAFQSSSSHIVLFTVPHEVWPHLEGNAGFQFIDYVDSHNLLIPGPIQQGQGSPSKGPPVQGPTAHGFPSQGSSAGPKAGGSENYPFRPSSVTRSSKSNDLHVNATD
ncbi:MAG: hypothetical protein Q9184_003150 [Pyrenodesmia sp. 2 TL-2023]